MGMYNLVYCRCPECQTKAEIQITQVVLGFGEFDLDDPESLADDDKLNEDTLIFLKECVVDEWFYCENDECNTYKFNPFRVEKQANKLALVRELFKKRSHGRTY
jgi:hypothetical protein